MSVTLCLNCIDGIGFAASISIYDSIPLWYMYSEANPLQQQGYMRG